MNLTKDFIRDIMSVPSCSKHEERMRLYIEAFAAAHGMRTRRDARGNLYLVKGELEPGERYPLLVNHMDTVFDDQAEAVAEDRRLELVETVTEQDRTVLRATGTGIGADDKLGCAIALAVADDLPKCKAVFFVEEELGLLGSADMDYSFLDDVSFALTLDCRERDRAASSCRRLKMFPKAFFDGILKDVCARHGVTMFEHQANTDIVRIMAKTDIVCFDFGNGGYLPHTVDEYLVVEDAQSAYRLARDLMLAVGTRYDGRIAPEERGDEGDRFLGALPLGVQRTQTNAVMQAVQGDPAVLQRVRASRDVEKPLLPGVTRRMVRDGLCLYLPESGKADRTLVYLHGGCWVFGGINSCSAYCMALAREGVAVLAYAYPLAPENRPDAVVAGCRDAVAWAMDHAAEWGGSADRVSVGGDSAGGNLSLAVALTSPADRMPRALLLYYPVTRAWADGSDSWRRYGRGYGLDAALMEAGNVAYAGDDREDPLVSPACAADDALRRLPPCHFLAAAHDILLDQGRDFHARLLSLGVETTHETVEGSVHLFVTVPGQPSAFRRAIAFALERL